jgi:hypothetical protein
VNDRDLEQLVSRLERPAPNPELDARIAEITSWTRPPRTGSSVRNVVQIGAALACAGLVGFVLGRQSVAMPSATPNVLQVSGQVVATAPEPTPEVRAVVPASAAFVQLVTKPKSFVSVFSGQPVEKRAGALEIQ